MPKMLKQQVEIWHYDLPVKGSDGQFVVFLKLQ